MEKGEESEKVEGEVGENKGEKEGDKEGWGEEEAPNDG